MENLEHLLTTFSLYLLGAGTAALIVIAMIALKAKKISAENKKLLFLAIVLVALIPTVVMGASTVYLNTVSSSKGPVHWHADFEVWNCGKEVDLKDPKGLSNKIGTATLHEHNDKRIHLEGVVYKPEDASLGKFFRVVGGELTSSSFSVPTNDGLLSVKNGDDCTGSGAEEVQVFVYRTDMDNYYSQAKIVDPPSYIISPQSNVPNGDCVIVEYDTPKDRTNKICRSYKVAEEIGKVRKSTNKQIIQ